MSNGNTCCEKLSGCNCRELRDQHFERNVRLHKQVWNNWWSRVKDLPGEKRVRVNEVTVAPGHVIDLDVELTEKGLKVSERGLTFTGFSLGEIEATINFTAAWSQLRGVTAGGETQLFHLLAAREISAQTRRAGLRVVKGDK